LRKVGNGISSKVLANPKESHFIGPKLIRALPGKKGVGRGLGIGIGRALT